MNSTKFMETTIDLNKKKMTADKLLAGNILSKSTIMKQAVDVAATSYDDVFEKAQREENITNMAKQICAVFFNDVDADVLNATIDAIMNMYYDKTYQIETMAAKICLRYDHSIATFDKLYDQRDFQKIIAETLLGKMDLFDKISFDMNPLEFENEDDEM